MAGKGTIAEHKEDGFGAVAQMELGAGLFHQAGGLQLGQHSHLAEDALVVRKQGFADVKAREDFLFQHRDTPAGACQEGCRRASPGAAADDHGVISHRIHAVIFRTNRSQDKRGGATSDF